MTRTIPGIHHVTAIAGEPGPNVEFYVGVLGLRLVKRTVNFDDPTTYHLYYGDDTGRPGTILTFFPWPDAPKGRPGLGQVIATGFSIPSGSVPYWAERLEEHAIRFDGPDPRGSEQVLGLEDPDGLRLELVADPDLDRDSHLWAGGPVPKEHAVRGFQGVTLAGEGYERTAKLLREGMDFRPPREVEDRFRFLAGGGGPEVPGSHVDILCRPTGAPGRIGRGTVHHVAFRTRNEEEQLAWRTSLVRRGLNVTPVIDRQYFRSIYFREPGGVLFEIATDPPGFTRDEPAERLGSELKLPPWLEEHRARLERVLPPLPLPEPHASGG